MNIGFLDLNFKNKKHGKKDINLEIHKEVFLYNGETIKYLKPIKFEGVLRIAEDVYTLKGIATTEILLACSRCGEEYSYEVSIDIDERFSSTINDEDGEIISIDNDKIDLYQIIENNLILQLPIKTLCREDCKGICQQCGTNLNHDSCKCETDDIDPRLAKLKDLFSNS